MQGRPNSPSLIARYLRLILPSLLIIAIGVGLLELVIDVFSISPIILPRPSLVFHAFVDELPNYPANIAVTLFEAVCGLALGATLAIGLAICITESRLFRQAAMPLIVAQQVLPIIVFAPSCSSGLAMAFSARSSSLPPSAFSRSPLRRSRA